MAIVFNYSRVLVEAGDVVAILLDSKLEIIIQNMKNMVFKAKSSNKINRISAFFFEHNQAQ